MSCHALGHCLCNLSCRSCLTCFYDGQMFDGKGKVSTECYVGYAPQLLEKGLQADLMPKGAGSRGRHAPSGKRTYQQICLQSIWPAILVHACPRTSRKGTMSRYCPCQSEDLPCVPLGDIMNIVTCNPRAESLMNIPIGSVFHRNGGWKNVTSFVHSTLRRKSRQRGLISRCCPLAAYYRSDESGCHAYTS